MHTLEELQAKADGIELAEVNFLTKNGRLVSGNYSAVAKAEFVFIDGAKLTLPRAELDRDGFGDLKFHLRPVRDHS